MGRFFRWKLRKLFDVWNFYSGQFHQNFFHNTYFLNCAFSFKFFWKSSVLRISSKKFLSSKFFEDFSKFRRIFIFVFGLFSRSEDSSSSVHFQSSLQHCVSLSIAICINIHCSIMFQKFSAVFPKLDYYHLKTWTPLWPALMGQDSYNTGRSSDAEIKDYYCVRI